VEEANGGDVEVMAGKTRRRRIVMTVGGTLTDGESSTASLSGINSKLA